MMTWKILPALALLLPTAAANALKFHSYINEQGETVFSNVPVECVKKSALTCMKYHPVLSSEKNKKRATAEVPEKPRQTSNQAEGAGSPAARLGRNSTDSSDTNLNLGTLQRIVEMNRLVDQYFPAQGDPAIVRDVRQQQEKILQVLEVIKGSADDTQQPTIDRAMDILRSNLAQ